MKITKRYESFAKKRRVLAPCCRPKKREYQRLKEMVAGLQSEINAARSKRTAEFIPFIPPPDLPDFEHPCYYECYLAGIAWLNCCLTINEALDTYQLYLDAAEDCIAAHEV